jgi:hypothetical protein
MPEPLEVAVSRLRKYAARVATETTTPAMTLTSIQKKAIRERGFLGFPRTGYTSDETVVVRGWRLWADYGLSNTRSGRVTDEWIEVWLTTEGTLVEAEVHEEVNPRAPVILIRRVEVKPLSDRRCTAADPRSAKDKPCLGFSSRLAKL